MSQFNIDEIEKRTLSGLKDFQRATVERVDYLFRHNQNRVLVADEVGMGKTLIARGAIVKTARLRIEEKDDLFKVIYMPLTHQCVHLCLPQHQSDRKDWIFIITAE